MAVHSDGLSHDLVSLLIRLSPPPLIAVVEVSHNKPDSATSAVRPHPVVTAEKSNDRQRKHIRPLHSMSATRTPQAIEKAEGFTPEEVVDTVECLMRDTDLANAYLALSSPDLGAAIIRREITKSALPAPESPGHR